MSKQNEMSLDELEAISAGVKDGGCFIIRPCFPMPPLGRSTVQASIRR